MICYENIVDVAHIKKKKKKKKKNPTIRDKN